MLSTEKREEANMQQHDLARQWHPTRRAMLASVAALGGAPLARNFAFAQAGGAARRIDLHHHYFPPAFLEAQRTALIRQNRPPTLGALIEGWSKAKTLEAMD